MDFMFRISLRKPADMPATEFWSAWLAEAEPSLGAIAGGYLQIWKVAGRDEAVGIMSVETLDDLDGIYDLPMWASGNQHVVESVEWTPLRAHAAWVEDLKRLSARR
jgi:muconolactone delta-isomerase